MVLHDQDLDPRLKVKVGSLFPVIVDIECKVDCEGMSLFHLGITNWLDALSLQQYTNLLAKYSGVEEILDWTEVDFKEIGVKHGGHRATLISSLVLLREKQRKKARLKLSNPHHNNSNPDLKQLDPDSLSQHHTVQRLSESTPASPATGRKQDKSEVSLCVDDISPELLRRELEEELKLDYGDIRSHAWYHAGTSRESAERTLNTDGLFLVRDCRSRPGDYVLSCSWRNAPLHFVINKVILNPGTTYSQIQYQFERESFDSVPSLIRFYVGSGKPISNSTGAVITHPANRNIPLRYSSLLLEGERRARVPSGSYNSTLLQPVIHQQYVPAYTLDRLTHHHRQRQHTPSNHSNHNTDIVHQRSASLTLPPRHPPSLPSRLYSSPRPPHPRTPYTTPPSVPYSPYTTPPSAPYSPVPVYNTPSVPHNPYQTPNNLAYTEYSQPRECEYDVPNDSKDEDYDYSELDESAIEHFNKPTDYDVPNQPKTSIISGEYTILMKKSMQYSNNTNTNRGRPSYTFIDKQPPTDIYKHTTTTTITTTTHTTTTTTDTSSSVIPAVEKCMSLTPTTYNTQLLSDCNKPVEGSVMSAINVMLLNVDSLILAQHCTLVDLQMCGLYNREGRISELGVSSGLELLTLPQGLQTRLDLYERINDIKYWVAVCILLPTSCEERADILSSFIQLADSLKTHLGNLFSFTSVMDGLCLPQVTRLRETWSTLRKTHTDIAVLFEARLRPQLTALNTGTSTIPVTSTTLPHINPFIQLTTFELIDSDCEEDVLNFAADVEIERVHYHTAALRTYVRQAAVYTINANMRLEGFQPDVNIEDLFRTQFHMRLMWGFRGCEFEQGPRFSKFEQVLKVLSERAEQGDVSC